MLKTNSHTYTFESKIWLWNVQKGSWHFLSLPVELSDKISQDYAYLKAGWGSIKATVTIGESVWDTSIFPDKKNGQYILPIKAEVREKNNLFEGSVVAVQIRIKFAL